ncbi:MAG: cation-translocating P-type ATPase C-terminal domain-containing protein, partial [Pseudomonadota bacterium]
IVFLEFVIDPACSIVFEAERSEEDAMRRAPRDPAEPLFSGAMLAASLLAGVALLATVALAYGWAVGAGRSEPEARALGFAAIVFGNLALILASRSRERTILASLRRPNPAFWWIVAGTLAALAGAIYVPPAAQVFRFAPLGVPELLVALGAGVPGVLAFDALRRAWRG